MQQCSLMKTNQTQEKLQKVTWTPYPEEDCLHSASIFPSLLLHQWVCDVLCRDTGVRHSLSSTQHPDENIGKSVLWLKGKKGATEEKPLPLVREFIFYLSLSSYLTFQPETPNSWYLPRSSFLSSLSHSPPVFPFHLANLTSCGIFPVQLFRSSTNLHCNVE